MTTADFSNPHGLRQVAYFVPFEFQLDSDVLNEGAR
jgi:hypothetical protein